MENWNQEQLENAINENELVWLQIQKCLYVFQGRANLNRATEIVCKFFIEAIESNKYGWFWEWYVSSSSCLLFHYTASPNGKDCKYRHALPPGFILKKKETEEERRDREAREKSNQITIEDFLEKEV